MKRLDDHPMFCLAMLAVIVMTLLVVPWSATNAALLAYLSTALGWNVRGFIDGKRREHELPPT